MYQNTFSYTETRIQELQSNSAQPAAIAATFGQQFRQDAASALIGLGNWIKPRSKNAAQSPLSIRHAGFAS